jgi:PrtD family type I secretion system ABC transporter
MLVPVRWRITRYSAHARSMLAYSVLANLLVIAPSIHMLQVYDRVLASRSLSTLVYLTLIVAFAMCIWGLADAVRGRLAVRVAARFTVETAPKLFARLARGGGSTQDSAQALRDFSSARSFIGGRSLVLLFDLPFIPFYLGIMTLLHWSLGLLTLIGIICLGILSWLNMVSTEPQRDRSRMAENEATGWAQAAVSRGEDLRAGGMVATFMSIWSRRIVESLKDTESAGVESNRYQAISKAFRQILQVLMMAWGAFLVIQNQMSAGMIFMASMVSGKAFGPIDQLTAAWEQVSKGIAAMRDLETFLGPDTSVQPRAALPAPKGALAARGLVFAPNPEKPDYRILDSVDLDLKPGEAIVIAGAIGAGKSTMLRLLAGAIEPTAGQLTIDGIDYQAWPSAQWGDIIGYVPQDIEFFPGTIAANIARFRQDASQEAILAAAQKANVHEAILKLPDGYRTIVGTGNSAHLSSGQKQKIALARALYGSPRILILDEPNANLDQVGEAALLAAIADARLNGTAVIIAAHRNSILRVVDRVLVLKDGKLQPAALGRQGEPSVAAEPSKVAS